MPTEMTDGGGVPNWELDQYEIIMDDPASWQLVIAGPGTGKTAVACQRIAFLVDDGIPPSRILLISFTRTAVAELQSRIVSYAEAGDRARNVRISTIDSHAWVLRFGCDDKPLPKVFGDDSYELGIERVIQLFQDRQADLIDFMGRLEHLIIDEAQDVVGVRAKLIIEMLRSLDGNCGVTILADPQQAIYGFTTDEDESDSAAVSLLSILESQSPRKLSPRKLEKIHRIRNEELRQVFQQTYKEVEDNSNPSGHVGRVQSTIRASSGHDLGAKSFADLPEFLKSFEKGTVLVLFRRRADVLVASSYCSQAGLEHRLRMSGSPVVTQPWIGWLFGDFTQSIISRDEFDELWDQRQARESVPFNGLSKKGGWTHLHRIAAGQRSETLDLVYLRQVLSRSKPPVDVCSQELGTSGPILGTIHASKGREADTVLLVMPNSSRKYEPGEDSAIFEEGRVWHVGATRARETLIVVVNAGVRVSYLESSRRVFRKIDERKVQMEVGREDDVDRIAHLAWSDGGETQAALASCAGRTVPVQASARPELNYAIQLFLNLRSQDGISRIIPIGQMSEEFKREVGRIWTEMDGRNRYRPATTIPHLYLTGVSTVGLSDEDRMAVGSPFSRSGFALAPVVKGFPTMQFLFRRGGRAG